MLLRLIILKNTMKKRNTFHIGANKWFLTEGKKYSQPLCKGRDSYVCELFSFPAMGLRNVSFRDFFVCFIICNPVCNRIKTSYG